VKLTALGRTKVQKTAKWDNTNLVGPWGSSVALQKSFQASMSLFSNSSKETNLSWFASNVTKNVLKMKECPCTRLRLGRNRWTCSTIIIKAIHAESMCANMQILKRVCWIVTFWSETINKTSMKGYFFRSIMIVTNGKKNWRMSQTMASRTSSWYWSNLYSELIWWMLTASRKKRQKSTISHF